jgi:anti-anti-sigma regulatory factor
LAQAALAAVAVRKFERLGRGRNPLSLRIEGQPGSNYFSLVGDLDLSTVDGLDDAIGGTLGDGDIVLDLARVTFVDVVGLHALSRLGMSLAERRLRLLIHEPTPELRTMFLLLGEERVLNVTLVPSDASPAADRARPTGRTPLDGRLKAG